MASIKYILYSFLMVATLTSCKTGKKAYERGNYYLSVIQSVYKLRSQPNNKKAKTTLKKAYPLAIQTYLLNNENLLASNDPGKYKRILANYNKINHMYEEVLRSPVALGIIPQPVNYYAKMDEIKHQAAAESYANGLAYLNKGTRADAKLAYNHFIEAQSYIRDFKDVNQKLIDARELATLHVLLAIDPVPATFAVSGSYFKNKISEYLNTNRTKTDFVEFYSPEEILASGIQPDQKVTLRYQEFNIGNVYMKETKEQLSKDSVIVATYTKNKANQNVAEGIMAKADKNKEKITICHKNGNKYQTISISASALQAHLNHGDTMGPCDTGISTDEPDKPKKPDNPKKPTDPKKPADPIEHKGPKYPNTPQNPKDSTNTGEIINVYATVHAVMTTYEKTITSTAVLSMTITDNTLDKVLKVERFPVEHVWQSTWATFNGDERALTKEQLELTTKKELPAPSKDEIFNMLSEEFYHKVTQNISNFYSRY